MSEERSSRKSGKGKERKRRKEEEDDDDSEHTTTTKKPRTATTSDSIAALFKTKTLRKRLQPDGASSSSKTTKPKKERKPRKKSATSTSKSEPSTRGTLDKYFASSTSQVTETGAKESKGHQLIIFFQVESCRDRITKIAARVIHGEYSTALTVPTYYSCVDHGLFEDILGSDADTDRAFTKVFPEMIEWITKTTAEVMKHYGTNTTYYPVLAAHNGFTFHFRVLLDEMEHCSIDTDILAENGIQFADTYLGLNKAKEQGVVEMEKLKLEDIHSKYMSTPYSGDDPEQKLELLEKIFKSMTDDVLYDLLPTRTAEEQVKEWREHKEINQLRQRINQGHPLNDGLSFDQCKKLYEKGLNYEDLRTIRMECRDDDDHTFEDRLQEELGPRSKKLIEKLLKLIKTEKSGGETGWKSTRKRKNNCFDSSSLVVPQAKKPKRLVEEITNKQYYCTCTRCKKFYRDLEPINLKIFQKSGKCHFRREETPPELWEISFPESEGDD